MHILDLIIYLISIPILWKIIDVMTNGEYVEELGAIAGYPHFELLRFLKGYLNRLKQPVLIVYTIIYVILFVWVDYNWIDIFHSIRDGFINWYSNLRL